MNGVLATALPAGFLATTIVSLERGQTPSVAIRPTPLAAILPQVLERYGVANDLPAGRTATGSPATELDLLA
jgi:hypothetical protein